MEFACLEYVLTVSYLRVSDCQAVDVMSHNWILSEALTTGKVFRSTECANVTRSVITWPSRMHKVCFHSVWHKV